MCGIVGITGRSSVSGRLLDGLARLEYRGYDSAGIAISEDGQVEERRAKGRLSSLKHLVEQSPLDGATGIAHTRWATHGKPNVVNAHPHITEKVAIVHNGIIENFGVLKAELEALGQVFKSETDSEVIANLLDYNLEQGMDATQAFAKMLDRLSGAFAIAAIFADYGGLMIGARRGSPLVLGYGEGEMYLGSDAIALAPLTREVSYLEEGDWVVTYPDKAEIYSSEGLRVERARLTSRVNASMVELGEFSHFMRKEIFEQSDTIARSMAPYVNQSDNHVQLDQDLIAAFAGADRVVCVSCGTSNYAGQTAKYWFEGLAKLSLETDIASEYRYRKPILPQTGPAIFITQSGETADTLAALRYCKARKTPTVALVNVPESTIAREASYLVQTHAGPEIGVASTKAFTAQLVVLAMLCIAVGKARGSIDPDAEKKSLAALHSLPRLVNETIELEAGIKGIAEGVFKARSALFLGRGVYFPIAMEGALKLKEVSYIHAEGYAAGELKHGPIALIEDDLPVIVVAPYDDMFEKTLSNMSEVKARGAKIILFSDARGIQEAKHITTDVIELPKAEGLAAPIIAAVALQLFAYHIALLRGTDVDKPRNLAKSVTVE